MEPFKYNKSLLDRLNEAAEIFEATRPSIITASQVRAEWTNYVEVTVEPAGWQAIWRIPRVICDALNIKYPTIVVGTVDHIFFNELKANLAVIWTEGDIDKLPVMNEVSLIDLWPTTQQENDALNIDITANCMDMLRYFYKNIWMPWDDENDLDVDWPQQHLQSRIRFNYDLQKGMSQGMATYIRDQLAEARYIKEQQEYIQIDIDDEDMPTQETHESNKYRLIQFHLRLMAIKSEIEMMENPEMRAVYEKFKFPDANINGNDGTLIDFLMVTKDCLIEQQLSLIHI